MMTKMEIFVQMEETHMSKKHDSNDFPQECERKLLENNY